MVLSTFITTLVTPRSSLAEAWQLGPSILPFTVAPALGTCQLTLGAVTSEGRRCAVERLKLAMQRRVAARRRWAAATLLVEAEPAVARWARLAQMAATRWAEALAVGT
jgi:hypothetical protein